MQLGVNLGYWGKSNQFNVVALAREAERLGFDSAWVSEAYSSDAVTAATWVAAHTSSIHVGTAAMQIPARSAATTAMSAATLDHFSEGRFRLGLGVSSPQIAEGWHGQSFERPLKRTREYVEIVRMALNGEKVNVDGEVYKIPLAGSNAQSLRMQINPVQDHLPIYLASVGPQSVELAGEIADGWIAMFFAPELCDVRKEQIARGARRGGRESASFDTMAVVSMVIGDDVELCADALRTDTAIYFGGIGAPGTNHYSDLASAMGFGDGVARVRQKVSERDFAGAAAEMPMGLIDSTALLGSESRIAERMARYSDCGVTTLCISPHGADLDQQIATLRVAAKVRAAF